MAGKEGSMARAAGIAVATGIVWSIYKSIKNRREEDAVLQAYFGDEETQPAIAQQVHTDLKEVNVSIGSEARELNVEVVKKAAFFWGNNKKKAKMSWRYEIKNGDTLWGISAEYGISLESLKAANGIHGDDIYAGDTLVIPLE